MTCVEPIDTPPKIFVSHPSLSVLFDMYNLGIKTPHIHITIIIIIIIYIYDRDIPVIFPCLSQ